MDGVAQDTKEEILIYMIAVIVSRAHKGNEMGEEGMKVALLFILFLKEIGTVTATGRCRINEFFIEKTEP